MDLTTLKDKYANLEQVQLNSNLKQNTADDIKCYISVGLNIIPLKPHTKEPSGLGWTSKSGTTDVNFENCNYGLRLDYTFEDGSYLASIDIEDAYPDVLLKYFSEQLELNLDNIPWSRTQSGAYHLYIRTDKELRPIKITDGKNVIVELRMGSGQQNVIGPSIYLDESTGELKPYITYGNIINAPLIPSALIESAFEELGQKPEALLEKKTIVKKSDFTKTVYDYELEAIYEALEVLRTYRITRDEWIQCGFALIDRFGEAAKPYFLHLSMNSNFPEDTCESIEKQFRNLLSTSKGEVTLGSLFYIAKKYGFVYPDDESIEQSEQQTEAMTFDKELEEQFRFDDKRDPNKLLGFPLTKFKELAKNTDGLQAGFYLLGAESNVGKTAVLTNMCLDVIETNPEASAIYFSLDDSRKYTAYRFLSIMTQMHINETRKQQKDPVKKKLLDEKRAELIELIRSGRLIVKDISEVQHIDSLAQEIKNIHDKKNIVVFIDGLYNLEVGDKFKGGIREENIERARKIKELVDTYRIPILTTGELRKKTKDEGKDKAPTVHDLMETGKFAYNANVVWMLYGKMEDLKSNEPILTLEFVKNKLSDFKGIQYLSFKRATGTMLEFTLPVEGDVKPKCAPFNDGGGLE